MFAALPLSFSLTCSRSHISQVEALNLCQFVKVEVVVVVVVAEKGKFKLASLNKSHHISAIHFSAPADSRCDLMNRQAGRQECTASGTLTQYNS